MQIFQQDTNYILKCFVTSKHTYISVAANPAYRIQLKSRMELLLSTTGNS